MTATKNFLKSGIRRLLRLLICWRPIARRRAIDGFEEPVFYQGAVVGAVRKYSDRMLELLLKGHAPEKYKDRVQHSGDVKVNVTEQALLEARQRASKYRS